MRGGGAEVACPNTFRAPARSPAAWLVLGALAITAASTVMAASPENTVVGQFPAPAGDGAIPAPWTVEQFDKGVAPTKYRLRQWDGVNAVEASAEHSMAVLVRPVEIDLAATPVLCWRWRVESTIAQANIRTKAGDDYAARIYLMFRVDPKHLGFGVRTQLALARAVRGSQVPDAAINYVWDHASPVGTVVPNAYTDRAMMWVLKTGDAEAGRWVSERRDIAADFRQAFGHPPAKLFGVAVATDTDQTGGKAKAGFADLRFVAADRACD
jgi:hypothetical protein